MTPRELYEKHKGKRVKFIEFTGISYGVIVGYYDDNIIDNSGILIAAITEKHQPTWKAMRSFDYIFDMFDNPLGYKYALTRNIIPSIKFGR